MSSLRLLLTPGLYWLWHRSGQRTEATEHQPLVKANATGDRLHSELAWQLSCEYDLKIGTHELRRYRFAQRPRTIRTVLRDEPRAVPLLGMSGTSCLAWTEITWEGVCLDQCLQPGRLIVLRPTWANMLGPDHSEQSLHLLAWQAPLPTHSLVSWGNGAELLDGPQELTGFDRKAAGYMFHHGRPVTWGAITSGRLDAWWEAAGIRTLAPRPPEIT